MDAQVPQIDISPTGGMIVKVLEEFFRSYVPQAGSFKNHFEPTPCFADPSQEGSWGECRRFPSFGGVPEGRGGFGEPDCDSLLDSIAALRLTGVVDVEDQVKVLSARFARFRRCTLLPRGFGADSGKDCRCGGSPHRLKGRFLATRERTERKELERKRNGFHNE